MAKAKSYVYIMGDNMYFPKTIRAKKRTFGCAALDINKKIIEAYRTGRGGYHIEGAKPLKDDFGDYLFKVNNDIKGQHKYFIDVAEDNSGFTLTIHEARFDTTSDRWYAGAPKDLEIGDYLAFECEVELYNSYKFFTDGSYFDTVKTERIYDFNDFQGEADREGHFYFRDGKSGDSWNLHTDGTYYWKHDGVMYKSLDPNSPLVTNTANQVSIPKAEIIGYDFFTTLPEVLEKFGIEFDNSSW